VRRWIPWLAAAVLLLSGCEVTLQLDPSASSPTDVGLGHVPAGTLDPAAASAALLDLPVEEKGTLAGYERDCGDGEGCVFGPRWADVDRNGCDQRNDVLRRDLTGVALREGTHGCVVEAGTLADPYTGATVPFEKADAAEVPIDHVVPLAAAWTQGAAAWSTEERTAFANDPANLLATTRAQNSAKGDSSAEEWVPPNAEFGCSYAAVVITVKDRYELSVTPAEADELESLLATC
jgi:hypothetical protein